MKLFQQMLVAPAALGLMAPVAVSAAELDLNGVSNYTDSASEVVNTQDFSDVYPGDWAFNALVELAERHGCKASTPSGSITRYEAAALLNQCLASVPEVNEEERSLLNEFGPELAVIKGRLDGLEARVGEFEAGQFSATTKLSGKYFFTLGAVDFDDGATSNEATTFTYSLKADVNTSFNGEDNLYTRIRQGNAPSATFGSKDNGLYLASTNTKTALTIDKLWYTWPVGDNLRFWAGPKIENYYMLASSPSIYKPVLKQFALGGNGPAYGSSTDGGFGVAWTQSVDDPTQARFAVSTNYASKGASSTADDGGGLFTNSKSKWLTKVEYGAPRWQVSAAFAKHNCISDDTTATDTCNNWGDYFSTSSGKNPTSDNTALGLRAYWRPESTGIIPALQIGWDQMWVDAENSPDSSQMEEAAGWMIGAMWKDAFIDGNTLGAAFGSRVHGTEYEDSTEDGAEDNSVWEIYYDYKVSDSITITPAIFGGTDTFTGTNDDVFGGVVQTTFKF